MSTNLIEEAKIPEADDAVGGAANRAGRAVSHGYERLRDTARDSYEYSRDKLQDWEAGLEDHVRSRPVLTLAVAVGVGFVVGFLVRGKPKLRRK